MRSGAGAQKDPERPELDSAIKSEGEGKMAKCGAKTEVYSRVCGYFRPVANWNKGKREEFKDRKTFETDGCACLKKANA